MKATNLPTNFWMVSGTSSERIIYLYGRIKAITYVRIIYSDFCGTISVGRLAYTSVEDALEAAKISIILESADLALLITRKSKFKYWVDSIINVISAKLFFWREGIAA